MERSSVRMRKLSWEIKLGISLVTFSALVYTVKYFVLGDPTNTYNYVFNALGFLPINVLDLDSKQAAQYQGKAV